MSSPKHQKSIRFKPEHYEAITEMMKEDELTFQGVIDRMLDDSFALFEKKVEKLNQENAKQLEDLKKTLEAQKDELSLENQRLTAKIDELTEIEEEQTNTIKDLTKAVETLSAQLNDLTNAHDEKSRTLDDLTTRHVNLRLTPLQMEALEAFIKYRAQYELSSAHDENSESLEEIVYVHLARGISRRNWKPDNYDYDDLFCSLAEHLERLNIEKAELNPEIEAVDKIPENATDDDDDNETDFEDEGPADE